MRDLCRGHRSPIALGRHRSCPIPIRKKNGLNIGNLLSIEPRTLICDTRDDEDEKNQATSVESSNIKINGCEQRSVNTDTTASNKVHESVETSTQNETKAMPEASLEGELCALSEESLEDETLCASYSINVKRSISLGHHVLPFSSPKDLNAGYYRGLSCAAVSNAKLESWKKELELKTVESKSLCVDEAMDIRALYLDDNSLVMSDEDSVVTNESEADGSLAINECEEEEGFIDYLARTFSAIGYATLHCRSTRKNIYDGKHQHAYQ